MNNDRGPGPVPERWLNCPRKATSLVADKFLAFKTPLSNAFDSQVEPVHRFTPAMLISSTKAYKWRIGLWIDLTNTSRFYDKSEVSDGYGVEKKVAYTKISCLGHGETPSMEQTNSFIMLCRTFIQQHPLEIIGVHCTHGFNRTGFLIVSYLVVELDFSVEAALQEFAKCRPPGIYKGDYIQELYRRYGDEDAAPPPPLRPQWCLEFDDSNGNEDGSNDYGASESNGSGSGKRKGNNSHGHNKRRYRDVKNPMFMEGVGGVKSVLDQPRLSQLQDVCHRMTRWDSTGFPGSQPVSMDLQNIKLLKEHPYCVSWKADGVRYMMMILGENEVYFIDRDFSIFEVTGMTFVSKGNLTKHLENTLLDGEMVIDKHKGQNIPRYLVYDVITVGGKDVSEEKFFPDRLLRIDTEIVTPRINAMREGKIDKLSEPFSVRAKPFNPVEKAEGYLSDKFTRQLSHDPDGLIFQPCNDPYKPGVCPEVLKWKPPSLNSVDFRLKIFEEKGKGILTRKVGQLFVGSLDRPFSVMPFNKNLRQYDNKIIECKFENGKWVFMRERTDKSYPNSFSTATAVCESIKNPVTKEMLLKFIAHHRYRSDRSLMPPPPIAR